MVELINHASNSIFGKNPIRRVFPNPVTYCVASNHSFDDEYEWDRVDTKLLGSSPVMWINVPGACRCKVIHGGITCASKVINVEVKSKSDSGIYNNIHACSIHVYVLNSLDL